MPMNPRESAGAPTLGEPAISASNTPLRDDLSSRLLPESDAANMIGVAVGQNDVLDRPIARGRENLPGVGGLTFRRCIDDDIARWSGNEVGIARAGSHIDGVADLG